jgi:hypothetical protein
MLLSSRWAAPSGVIDPLIVEAVNQFKVRSCLMMAKRSPAMRTG